MNDIKIFENEDFGEIRTVMIDGEPWFVGRDVAKALGYAKPENAISKWVDSDDTLKRGITDSLGREQETTIINESGLYSLILSSKLPSAKKFKHWVTADVLPSIRKSGVYFKEKNYETKATSLGEVASYTKEMDRRMEKQGSEPWKVCEAFKMVSEQFGIRLPDDFVKIPQYEQMTLDI